MKNTFSVEMIILALKRLNILFSQSSWQTKLRDKYKFYILLIGSEDSIIKYDKIYIPIQFHDKKVIELIQKI